MDQPTRITIGHSARDWETYQARLRDGLNIYRQPQDFAVQIDTDDLRQHLWGVGGTGVGKTKFLINLMCQLIHDGHGLTFIDVKGDDSRELLDFIPNERIQHVRFLDPTDYEQPVGFNILQNVPREHRARLAANYTTMFVSVWDTGYPMPRAEDILYNAIAALMDFPSGTLLGIHRLLRDDMFRREVVTHITDPMIKDYWQNEWPGYTSQYRRDATGAITNKMRKHLTAPHIRNIIGQPKSTISPQKVMNTGKILICHLPKGSLGTEHAKLLGGLLSAYIIYTGMSRSSLPREKRRQHFLVVDEFQNFGTAAFDDGLSELRSANISLIIAHQHLGQISKEMLQSLTANTKTRLFFQLDSSDIRNIIPPNTDNVAEALFCDMPRYHAVLRYPDEDDGSPQQLLVRMLPPLADKYRYGYAKSVIEQSRKRFGNPRKDVEANIERFLQPPEREYHSPLTTRK